MFRTLVSVAVSVTAAFSQDLKPVIDNDRVTVWDVTWTKGQTNPARGHDRDAFVMWIAGPKAGSASFSAKGDGRTQEGIPDANPSRSLIIELKDHIVPPIEN